MSRSILALLGWLALTATTFVPCAFSQNLLTNNAGFETNTDYYTPGWGFPQGSPQVLPGWVITLDPAGDGYAGASANPPPQEMEGNHFGYIYSGTGTSGLLETAPDSRAPVEAGKTYTLWFLSRGDAEWGEALATVSLTWHPNQNSGATVGDPTNLDLTLPVRISTEDPMQTFGITAVAPPGAAFAGVRVTRPPHNYVPLLVDGFVITAEPAEISLSIKKQGPDAVLSWPRSRKHRLEVNDLILTNGWITMDKPPKGLGATNYLDFSLTNSARFFRLAAPK